jgi:hypothetical protein
MTRNGEAHVRKVGDLARVNGNYLVGSLIPILCRRRADGIDWQPIHARLKVTNRIRAAGIVEINGQEARRLQFKVDEIIVRERRWFLAFGHGVFEVSVKPVQAFCCFSDMARTIHADD